MISEENRKRIEGYADKYARSQGLLPGADYASRDTRTY